MARIRTIKPEFWTSEQIVECSRDARLLFIGLWNFADDGGVIPSSERAIKMRVFPAEDDIGSTTIRRLLDELVSNDLIYEYTVDSKSYIRIRGWHHQRIDRPTFKHPGPDQADSTTDRRAFDDQSTPDVDVEGKGREEDVDVEEGALGERSPSTPSMVEDPVVIRITLVDKTEHSVTQSQVDEWQSLFPAVDVLQALRHMRAWCDANPSRRKTPKGITRFITNWLAREQDKGGTQSPNGAGSPAGGYSRNQYAAEEAARQLAEEGGHAGS